MKSITFEKYQSAGNDYIIILGNDSDFSSLDKNKIVNLCDRRKGIGASGLLIIDSIIDNKFAVSFYSAKGELSDLEAGAARSLIKFASNKKIFHGNESVISCRNKEYFAEMLDSKFIRFSYTESMKIELDKKIETVYGPIKYHSVSGSDSNIVVNAAENEILFHCIDSWEDLPVYNLGGELRYHKSFLPEGTNVNFIKFKDCEIQIRTYKKGIEEEVLSSSSGAAASALVASEKNLIESPVEFITRGGEQIFVEFQKQDDGLTKLAAIGPAEQIFEGNFVI